MLSPHSPAWLNLESKKPKLRREEPELACIDKHFDDLIEVCCSAKGALMDPYINRMSDIVCADCEYQFEAECPCRLKNLLPLAAKSLDSAAEERSTLANRLAWPYEQMPESD